MTEFSPYWLTRFLLQRSLGFIYFLGFLIAFHQFSALAGEHGLLPMGLFFKRIHFWDAPGLFWLNTSDRFVFFITGSGVALSIAAVTGLSEKFGPWVSAGVWSLLWLFYLSIVNAGQTFYGFGWETLLLEAGFLAIFLGSAKTAPPVIVIWLFRWLLFRVMLGAGLIKIRGDECWRNLTCLAFHYETQPLPNPLSFYFHQFPLWIHKAGVLFNHFIELVVPWAFFLPQPWAAGAGLFTILFQSILILSGNLSWLNYITIVLAFSCFNDPFLSKFIPIRPETVEPSGLFRNGALIMLAAAVSILSIKPVLNLFSKKQAMNTSFDSLHLVNTYGAFGSITRIRREIVIQGTDDAVLTPQTKWQNYEFKGKPGDPKRAPPLVSPYHYKLDWQMWFAAMSPYYYHPWFLNLMAKFLQGDQSTLNLIRINPFPEKPPHYVRAELYEYHFAVPGNSDGSWWEMRDLGVYFPPVSLSHSKFRRILEEQGWISKTG